MNAPENANVYWSESGSYRLETMLQKIQNLPDRSNLNIFCKEKGYAIYILDDYSVHLMDEVRKAFLKKGYILIISQLSRKITGIKKICKTWDLYQSILYTLEDCFLKKSKFFNTGFFFYRPISGFTL